MAALEIMVNTATVKDTILNGDSFDPIKDYMHNGGDTYGMQTFDQALLHLYQQGVITRDEALRQASNKDNMALLMSGVSA